MSKLQKFLSDKSKLEGDSSRKWKVEGNIEQENYRAGAANMCLEVLKFIEQNPDYNEEVK